MTRYWNGVDRLPVASDEGAQVGAGAVDTDAGFVLVHLDPAVDAERVGDLFEQRADVGGQIALGDGGDRRRVIDGPLLDHRDDARRRVADTEQSALALREHLEADRGLVEARLPALELAQRRPLRLADGLSRRLDDHVAGHRRARFFFLRTTRGWPVGFGAAGG